MSIPEDLIERLASAPVASQRRYPGGDISGASEVRLADGRVLVAKYGPVTDIEGRMLSAMAEGSAAVPQVIGQDDDVLLIERLAADGALSGKAWQSLAERLSRLHAIEGESFGWHEDYALRSVAVENAPLADWADFWARRRLECHLPHVPVPLGRRIEALCSRLPELIPQQPTPSLLHGDLWGGNVLVSQGAVTGLIDPCAYYGDREVDAATLTVFDDPPGQFFAALELPPGWQERQPVYRLWTWLLHVRLFGGGYAAAVERELAALGF